MHDEDQTPVLVGVGRFTQRKKENWKEYLPPHCLLEQAVRRALQDTGIDPAAILEAVDAVAVNSPPCDKTLSATGQTLDSPTSPETLRNMYTNMPRTIANLLNIKHSLDAEYVCNVGGHTPQFLVNHIAKKIVNGEHKLVVLAGGEALLGFTQLLKEGHAEDMLEHGWGDSPGGSPILLGEDRYPTTPTEEEHGMNRPIHVYALFESAIRAKMGHSIPQHMEHMGRLFQDFSKVAASDPENSWFPKERSWEEISTASDSNRYVGWPYTKYMNAVLLVNQSASLVMTSVAMAKKLGIHPSKWVYLHGFADVHETWHVSERTQWHSSPAMALMAKEALGMAGLTSDKIKYFDLYSCFPSAVEYMIDALGLDISWIYNDNTDNNNHNSHNKKSNKKMLSVVGGLPYHGGPGNNYSMHAIAKMVEVLRGEEGRGEYGWVNANGWYATEHSCGIYSTTPTPLSSVTNWRVLRKAEKQEEEAKGIPSVNFTQRIQNIVDNHVPREDVAKAPKGRGRIETYTVIFDPSNRPSSGIVLGRLEATNQRFVAVTPKDPELLDWMTKNECVGLYGHVQSEEGTSEGQSLFYLEKPQKAQL